MLCSEQATDAVNLLRSYFIGFLSNVIIEDEEYKEQTDFLTDEGVLIRSEIDVNCYHMASAFVDLLILQHVICRKFPNAPRISVPKYYEGGPIDVLGTLKECLKFFDKDLIQQATIRSYKIAKVKVDKHCGSQVPWESVYNTELIRVLRNWLSKLENYMVNGQYHLTGDEGEDKYAAIMIKKLDEPTVLLELLAHGELDSVVKHVNKTVEYKQLVSADEVWVIHFTREDDYLRDPYWPPDDQLKKDINMVHFWHDMNFTTVKMSARWKDEDGNIQQIDDELLTV